MSAAGRRLSTELDARPQVEHALAASSATRGQGCPYSSLRNSEGLRGRQGADAFRVLSGPPPLAGEALMEKDMLPVVLIIAICALLVYDIAANHGAWSHEALELVDGTWAS